MSGESKMFADEWMRVMGGEATVLRASGPDEMVSVRGELDAEPRTLTASGEQFYAGACVLEACDRDAGTRSLARAEAIRRLVEAAVSL